MWLFKSSVGRKFVMALTGLALVLFVTFHCLMNSVAILWPAAYNQVCEFLGANWYALIASIGLAALLILHIIYAVWLTVQNRAARGNDRYAVTTRPPQVEWASKNMLVLGIVVVAFLVVHLIQFWAKMQLQELLHNDLTVLPTLNGVPVGPAQGTLFLQLAFSQIWTPIVYIIGFVALWFHMTHGFWSMFHSSGLDNNNWICRLKCIGNWWTSIVIALFVAQAVVFTIQAKNNYYTQNTGLQEQYAEFWNEQAVKAMEDFRAPISAEETRLTSSIADNDMQARMEAQGKMEEFVGKYINENGPTFVEKAETIVNAYKKSCADIPMSQEVAGLEQFQRQVSSYMSINPNLNQPQQ